MDTDMDMDELPELPAQAGQMPAWPLSPWLVLASLAGLWGNVCRSVTFTCDELATGLVGHHRWCQQQAADLRVVDTFRQQLKVL